MSLVDGKFIAKGWVQEAASGTVNGVNDTFTISSEPREADALMVYVDGLKRTRTTEYTFSGTTITFQSGHIPVTGQSVEVEYFQKTGGS